MRDLVDRGGGILLAQRAWTRTSRPCSALLGSLPGGLRDQCRTNENKTSPAPQQSLRSRHLASCSTTMSRSLTGCQERGIILIPERSTRSANWPDVIGPAPFGPSATTGSPTDRAERSRSPAWTLACHSLIASSRLASSPQLYANRIHTAGAVHAVD